MAIGKHRFIFGRMTYLPAVSIEYIKHRGEDRILMRFAYDVVIVNLVKEMNAQYSTELGCWHIIDTPSNRSKLFDHMKGSAFLRWPSKHQKPARKEVLKVTKGGLTDEQERAMLNMINLLHANGKGERTVETYSGMVRKMLLHLKIEPKRLTSDDIIRYQSEYLVRNNYAGSTQRQFTSGIKWFLNANHLPGVDFEEIPRPRKEKKLPKTFTRGEVMSILSACRNMKHRTMLSLLYSSGLRVGELLDLRIDDIHFEKRAIHIKRAKGRKDRMVTYGEAMGTMLQNYIMEYRPKTFLFNGKGNIQYSAVSVREALKQAARRAGIHRQVTPHMLRHSFATHMIEDGVNLRYVQELLGHSRPETTQIYTHVASEHLMKLKNPFDDLLKRYGEPNSLDNNLTNSTSLSRKPRD